MSNFWIVVGREYMTRVKKKSFIILTILMPFLMVAMVSVPIFLGMIKDDTQHEVAVLDNTGKYIKLFMDAQRADSTRCEGYVFIPADRPLDSYRTEEEGPEAIVSIQDDLQENPDGVKIYSKGEIQMDLQRYVEDLLSEKLHHDKLETYNVPELDKIIVDIQKDISLQTVKWNDDGEETFSSSAIAMVLGMITAFLIYMFVLAYGAMVMQGVMEEKTSRIVEVIIGSVKPFHLMMGKIIGIMFVGFTQILIWGTMIVALFMIGGVAFGTSSMDSDTIQQTITTVADAKQQGAISQEDMAVAMAPGIHLPAGAEVEDNPMSDFMQAISNLPVTEIIILFVLYFLGGYILYASFYAAIGAAINSQEDSSQFMMPMMIVMVFAMYAAMGSMENTDGPLAFWASIFPLTSPIVMMVRLPFGVPLWQEVISVVLLYATALLFVWFSGRIYRVGILMYGKKPSIKDMIKWISFK